MKNPLLFLALGGMALTAGAAVNPAHETLLKSRAEVRRVAAINAAHAADWHAQKVTYYYWEGTAWGEPQVTDYQYDALGRVIKETHGADMVEYTYDDLGRLSGKKMYYIEEPAGTPHLMQEETYVYDTVVKDFLTETISRSGDGYSYSSGIRITRDAAGHVTKLQDFYGDNSYSFTEITYGADGKAVTIKEGEDTGEGQVSYYTQITDIVWENTDGQILSSDFDECDGGLYFGANRIKSARVIDEEWPYPANLTVTYSGTDYVSNLVMTTGEKLLSFNYKATDANGSYTCDGYEVDYDEDEGNYYVDVTVEGKTTYIVDSFGLVLLDEENATSTDSDGVIEPYVEGEKGLVTYDPTYGYPVEYIRQAKNSDQPAYENSERIVYSDYVNGVEEIAAGDSQEAVYFNLQGIRVANPSTGIYIRRQGDKVTKVILK